MLGAYPTTNMDFVALIEAEEAAKRKQAATCRDKRPRGTDDTDDTDDVSSPRADKKPRTAAAGDTPAKKEEEEFRSVRMLPLGGRISEEKVRRVKKRELMGADTARRLNDRLQAQVHALCVERAAIKTTAAKLRKQAQTLRDEKMAIETMAAKLRKQVQTLRDEKMVIEQEAVKLRQQLQALRDETVASEQEAAN